MPMGMMHIRQMRVRMLQRLVAMPMRVGLACWIGGRVLMPMMLGMSVGVRVL